VSTKIGMNSNVKIILFSRKLFVKKYYFVCGVGLAFN